jgi:hypothetical protein
MVQYFPVITGSLTVNGNLSVSGNVAVTGSMSGTSSLAANAELLSGTGSVGFTTTGSFTVASSSLSSRTTQIESVYATTGSNSFRATQSITGSLTVTGQIVAQTLNVQQVTSSIVYSSGSNTFGCDINSRQTFTGSFYQTGSIACFSNCLVVGGALNGTSANFNDLVTINKAASLSSLTIKSSSSTTGLQLYLFGLNATLSNQDNGSLAFQTNGNDRLTIASTGAATFSGSVSINQASVYSVFNLTGTDCGWGEGIVMNPAPNGYSALHFRLEGRTGSCTTCTWQLGKETSASGWGELLSLNKQGLTGGATYRADASQQWKTNGDSIFGFNVGIKNTSPQGALHIGSALASGGDAAAINLKQTGTNETTGIYLERSGERKGYAIYVGGSLDSLVFQRNNAGTKSDVMTLTRDGYVAIGNANPVSRLTINNAIVGATLPYINGTGLSYNSEGISVAGSNTSNTNIGNGLTLYNNVASVGAYSPVIAFSSLTSGGAYNATYAFISGVYRGAGGDANWATGDLIFGTGNSYGAVERVRITNAGILYVKNDGVDGSYQPMIGGMYNANNNETNLISTAVSSNATQSGFRFDVSNGAGSSGRTTAMTINRSSVTINGSLSKGSGTFNIEHPLESKKCTHRLVHSFIEGPQADLIYRGKINLDNGIACVNIDCSARMTEGTFEALNRCAQVFTTNESSWDAIKGKLHGNILVIESQNTESNDEISWMIIGQRQDKHMLETEWTDEEGRVITEPEIMP